MRFFLPIFLALSLLSSNIEANQFSFWSFFFGNNDKEAEQKSEEEAKLKNEELRKKEEEAKLKNEELKKREEEAKLKNEELKKKEEEEAEQKRQEEERQKDEEYNKKLKEKIEKYILLLSRIENNLKRKIVGQDKAIRTTLEAIERHIYGFGSANAPVGSLLYLGPTGVGKTELAKQLANEISASSPLIRINMAEYSADLRYGNKDILEELAAALKKNPGSMIVLFDEIEKASPSVQKALLQLLDEGFVINENKQKIDCRSNLFILTSNLASQKILTMHDLGCTDDEIVEEVLPLLMSKLSPEFLNRIEPVIFRGFKQEIVDDLIKALLVQASEEFQNKKGAAIEFDSSVISSLKSEENYKLGARPFKKAIKKRVAVTLMEAFKKRYFQKDDLLHMSFDGQNYILQTTREQEPFVRHCPKEERNPKPPFNLDDLLHLEEKLSQKVLEQSYPIKITVAALMRYAAGLGNEQTPLGAFLYAGPTGVGKTELAKVLAKELMGSENALIRFDMSSYSDKHSVWGLLGPTRGYINHEEGGHLTEALKEHPYCVLLLDEIEKAAPEVQKLFLSLLDEGYIKDSKGDVIDCRNVIIIATTNAAATTILELQLQGIEAEEIMKYVQPEICRTLSPELYNRFEVAPFKGLNEDLLEQLVNKLLDEVKELVQKKKKITPVFDSSLVDYLKEAGYSPELGARPLKRLIQQEVVTMLAKEIIKGTIQEGDSPIIYYVDGKVVIETS